MAVSDHSRPFRFFNLPREIRDDIYTCTMYFHDDFPCIILAPKGRVPSFYGEPSDHRAGLYKRYQEFVSLLTLSRQFRDEALPIFWQGNMFQVRKRINLASTPELQDWDDTVLGFIGPSGKMCIARISVPIDCTAFVTKPGGSEKNGEYVTDLGITIERLLEMMPNLQRLEISFGCNVKREDYPGWEKTDAVLKKAAGSLLEFLRPMQRIESSEPPKLVRYLMGGVAGRPIRALKEQETHV